MCQKAQIVCGISKPGERVNTTLGELWLIWGRTSGGIAIDHIATPAVPPANMIAPRLRSPDDEPAGVKAVLVTSYAAK
jgi:hypothetical protein